jgi:hypothetical protein
VDELNKTIEKLKEGGTGDEVEGKGDNDEMLQTVIVGGLSALAVGLITYAVLKLRN